MKVESSSTKFVPLLFGVLMGCAHQADSPGLNGPYLGQEPPGAASEVFAPGVVSTDSNEVMFGFFDDGALFFFERTPLDFEADWIHAPVYRTELTDGVWTEPEKSTATGRPWYLEYPEAPEGTVVVFPWRKNLDGSGPRLDIDLWRVVKRPNGWAEPVRLGPPVNTEAFDSWPSLSRSETLYFFSTRDGGFGKLDLYRSELHDSEYSEVENLGNLINTEFNDHDPFIAPDESYLVWCSDRPGGFGENDLYISYRMHDGAWTTPRNLGERINTPGDDTRPYVTTDGKYLFFNSTDSGSRDIYWVDSSVIEDHRPEDPRALVGDYLGQPPPGDTPAPFAPGLVSTEHADGCVGFGLEGNLFVFQRYENSVGRIFEMVRRNDRWDAPSELPFSASHRVGDFTIAPDGRTLYFQSNIAVEGIGPDAEGGNIWTATRTADGWTVPTVLGDAVNTRWHDSFPHAAADRTLYFFSRRPGGFGQSDLYVSRWVNGRYEDAENLGATVNTAAHEWDPFVSPEQDYMIFCSTKEGGFGEDDLYVTFRQADGEWSTPANMGTPINSDASENRPWVTPDGKYLFFASTRPGAGRSDVYWIDAGIIDTYRVR